MMRIKLNNQTGYTLTRLDYNATHGKWGTKPLQTILENHEGIIATAHDSGLFNLSKAEVWATYKIQETGDIVHWRAEIGSNPGSKNPNECDFRFDTDTGMFVLKSRIGSSGDPDVHLEMYLIA